MYGQNHELIVHITNCKACTQQCTALNKQLCLSLYLQARNNSRTNEQIFMKSDNSGSLPFWLESYNINPYSANVEYRVSTY